MLAPPPPVDSAEPMKILIVAWAWPPTGRVGALRPMGMAKEWSARGHVVHILTGPGDRGGEWSPDLEDRARATGAVVHRAPAPGLAARTRPIVARGATVADLVAGPPVGRLRQLLAQWRNFPDYQRSWIRPGIALARQVVHDTPIGVVWTSSPPESAHFIGRALARRGVPWVADFRDPWSEYFAARWDPLSRWLIDRIARWTLAPAWALTAATNGIASSMARAAHTLPTCVYNGYDEDSTATAPIVPRTLGYFGRVDPQYQHPDRLWPALRILRAAGTPWTVEFFLSPGGGGGANLSVPEDLRETVSVHPTLAHAVALQKMRTYGGLLALCLEHAQGQDIVPAKTFEYVGSGRPVLVISPAHFELRRLVQSRRVGVGAWETNEIVQALATLAEFQISEAGRRSLSREATAAALANLLRSTANREQRQRA